MSRRIGAVANGQAQASSADAWPLESAACDGAQRSEATRKGDPGSTPGCSTMTSFAGGSGHGEPHGLIARYPGQEGRGRAPRISGNIPPSAGSTPARQQPVFNDNPPEGAGKSNAVKVRVMQQEKAIKRTLSPRGAGTRVVVACIESPGVAVTLQSESDWPKLAPPRTHRLVDQGR